jgi:putative sigma-54 modulation protein
MKYEIHGDKIIVTDSIKQYVIQKLSKLCKYFEHSDDLTARVMIKAKNYKQTIEVTIPTQNFILRNEEYSDNLYTAIDLVADKLERQIVKNKTKLQNKLFKNKVKDFNFDNVIDDEDKKQVVVKRKRLETKPMVEEEAIIQMDMLGHDFFIYRDAHENTISVLYKRKDGNYGIIETK